jgi:hypothetical protein
LEIYNPWGGSHCDLFIKDLYVGTKNIVVKTEDNFREWIEKLRKKDEEKIKKVRTLIEGAEKDCKKIRDLWDCVKE